MLQVWPIKYSSRGLPSLRYFPNSLKFVSSPKATNARQKSQLRSGVVVSLVIESIAPEETPRDGKRKENANDAAKNPKTNFGNLFQISPRPIFCWLSFSP